MVRVTVKEHDRRAGGHGETHETREMKRVAPQHLEIGVPHAHVQLEGHAGVDPFPQQVGDQSRVVEADLPGRLDLAAPSSCRPTHLGRLGALRVEIESVAVRGDALGPDRTSRKTRRELGPERLDEAPGTGARASYVLRHALETDDLRAWGCGGARHRRQVEDPTRGVARVDEVATDAGRTEEQLVRMRGPE